MSFEEKPRTQVKKEHSYTYWVNENNKSRELPQEHRPKKLDQPVAINQEPCQGPSHWNKLGSWEERAVSTSELQETLDKAIKAFLQSQNSTLVLKKVSLDGEFRKIFSNNKRKIMYQIKGSIKFQSSEDCQIKLQELTCTGDREYSIKAKNAEEKAKVSAIANSLIELIIKEFNRYKQ